MSLTSRLAESRFAEFFGRRIANKLFFLLLLVGLLPMFVVAVSMYRSAYTGIEKQSFNNLDAIKTVKAKQLSDYFDFISSQIATFSEDRMIVEAMKGFPVAQRSAIAEAGVTPESLQEMKKQVNRYYAEQFAAEYRRRNDGAQPSLSNQFASLDDDSLYLQYQYISNNPNPLGSKENLDDAGDATQFSSLHRTFHPVIRSYLKKFGYYDIFLCDIETGDVVYSVFKELDFSTSLSKGPYANTNFGRVFEMAAKSETPGEVFFVDYENYTPSYEDPAGFVASPVFDGDKKVGVAVFQVPINRITAIMNERTGLGETGETYAVGPEGMYRNDSRFLDQLQVRSTILKKEFTVDTEATKSAFAGVSDTKIINDYRGTPVLSSWTPVTIYKGIPGKSPPINWALMSEIDHAEIKRPLGFFTIARNGLILIAIASVIGTIAVLLVAGRITKQAESIKDMLSNIGMGIFDARAEKITNDELGDVAVALNAMCDNTLSLIQSNDEREGIQASIENLIGEMKHIASGNLAVKAEVKEDITGTIASTVNHMTEQLRMIVAQVQNATYLVTDSAGDIANASTRLSQENDEQASRIVETSQQVLAITDQFQDVAKKTENSAQVAQQAREAATRGYQAVSNTVDGMSRIREQVQLTSKRIKRLGESSQEIGEIVQLISDIADRTSILALNASIQAAMAGDAGLGFAVVAEEVERLAERSTDATKQISTLIKSIQAETSDAIADMEESTREVVEGSQLATQAGQTLAEINEVSQQLERLIQGVSNSALQQANSAKRIASTIEEISSATKASAEKSRDASNQVTALATLANQLGESVTRFRLFEEESVEKNMIKQLNTVSSLVGDRSSYDAVTAGA